MASFSFKKLKEAILYIESYSCYQRSIVNTAHVQLQCTLYNYNVHCTTTMYTVQLQCTLYNYNVHCTTTMYTVQLQCTLYNYNVHCTTTMYTVQL